MYNEKEFGAKFGAIVQNASINGGVYTPPAKYHVYEVVPDASVTVKCVPIDTSMPYISSDRTANGSGVVKIAPFNGQYSSVTVTSGQCDIYIERTTGN